jgi:hypothetical protein
MMELFISMITAITSPLKTVKAKEKKGGGAKKKNVLKEEVIY